DARRQRGPAPVNTTGQKVGLPRGPFIIPADRWVRRGLVVRKKHPADRRVRRVELTRKGRALIAATFRKHATAMENVISVLSTKERVTLLRLLKKLGRHAERCDPERKRSKSVRVN